MDSFMLKLKVIVVIFRRREEQLDGIETAWRFWSESLCA